MTRAALAMVVASSAVVAAWLTQQRALEGTGLALADYGLAPPGLPELGGLEAIEASVAPIAVSIEGLLGLGPSAEELAAMTQDPNIAAFLWTIRTAEGTAGPEGYRTLYGGALFDTYADHPRRPVSALLGGKLITSTAAGAYQILARTWDDVVRALALPDFSPPMQDVAACWLIRRRGALEDARSGRFDAAIRKCALEWASLPGSPYGQPRKSLDQVRAAYAAAGGSIA